MAADNPFQPLKDGVDAFVAGAVKFPADIMSGLGRGAQSAANGIEPPIKGLAEMPVQILNTLISPLGAPPIGFPGFPGAEKKEEVKPLEEKKEEQVGARAAGPVGKETITISL